jgi:hypothetical protein
MKHLSFGPALALLLLGVATAAAADAPAKFNPKEALQPFNELIGTWRGTGQPEGTRAEKQRGFWTESLSWEWAFKGPDAWLTVAFDKGKHFVKGELRALPEKDRYQLTLENTANQTVTFTGTLKDRRLTLDRSDDQKKETQRLIITLLHNNRFLYRYDVKAADRANFAQVYQVGATKEGVPFADGETGPECVVSGGLGTIKVMYKGQTYYVCCSGCRRAFQDDPEKYIKEFEAKKGKPKGP